MKRIILFLLILIFGAKISIAQTPMQITGDDCNGIPHDLFAELDAGKAAVIFFFMDNCGICPPPANAIQTMMNNITDVYPGMVTGYAFPYNDGTTCTETINWCTNFGHLLAPYDSGAHQVAYYGGFGMPTVVLVGGSGANKRVLFSTLTFTYNDTTVMRDSILALFATGIADLPGNVSEFSVYPNPSGEHFFIKVNLKEMSNLTIDVADISGRQVATIISAKQQGIINRQFDASGLPGGNYFIRLQSNGSTAIRKITIVH